MNKTQYSSYLPATDSLSIALWKKVQSELSLPTALLCISLPAVSGRTVLSNSSSTLREHLNRKEVEKMFFLRFRKKLLLKKETLDVLECKDRWKGLQGEKVCSSFALLTFFPCSLSPLCPYSRTENEINLVSFYIICFFNFWKRRVIRIKPMILSTVENFTLSVALFWSKAWARCVPHALGGYKLAATAVHQPGSNKKVHSKQAFT